jgi:ABC-type antimicrobial peptide transport system permease subunit
MIWSGNFKAALSALRQSKWRSTFTMLGIIIGISSVVTIVSLGEGLKQQLAGQVNNLGANVLTVRPGKLIDGGHNLNLFSLFSASTLTPADIDSLNKLPNVAETAPIDFVTSSAQTDGISLDNVFVTGTSDQLPDFLRLKILYGGWFPDDDSNQAVAIIGINVAHKMFNDSNAVGHSLTINGQEFIVHGVLQPVNNGLLSIAQGDINTSIFIPFGTAKELNHGNTNILQIFVRGRGKESQTIPAVTGAITKNHGHQDFSVLKQDELLNVTNNLLNTVTGFIGAIAAISLIVGGIGIMDVMLVSVSERTREIGIRKAIGATNPQILNQFLVEGLVLTVGGGIIGILVSLAINGLLRLYTSWHPVINIPVLILAVILLTAVGLLFSIAPALKAARKDPIAALRGD